MQETWVVQLAALIAAGAPVERRHTFHVWPGITAASAGWVDAWGTKNAFHVPRSQQEAAREAEQGGSARGATRLASVPVLKDAIAGQFTFATYA